MRRKGGFIYLLTAYSPVNRTGPGHCRALAKERRKKEEWKRRTRKRKANIKKTADVCMACNYAHARFDDVELDLHFENVWKACPTNCLSSEPGNIRLKSRLSSESHWLQNESDSTRVVFRTLKLHNESNGCLLNLDISKSKQCYFWIWALKLQTDNAITEP